MSGGVERVAREHVEGHHGQGFLVRGAEHDRGCDAGIVGLFPAADAEAPAVAGLEARKPELRPRRGEVVALLGRERQEVPRHLGTDHVQAEIVGTGRTAPRAVEPRDRIGAAFGQGLAEHIQRVAVRVVFGHAKSPYIRRRR